VFAFKTNVPQRPARVANRRDEEGTVNAKTRRTENDSNAVTYQERVQERR